MIYLRVAPFLSSNMAFMVSNQGELVLMRNVMQKHSYYFSYMFKNALKMLTLLKLERANFLHSFRYIIELNCALLTVANVNKRT